MPIYNKLVRDKIPQIIKASGKSPTTKILNEKEYITELRKKSQEELEEYLTAKTDQEALEELADLLEIIHNLAKVHGSTIDVVENLRAAKAEKRGGFSDKVFLIEVKDD
jgi:predicted house-cleaning noncanonical NTP pyrophosphatase (MazG superfamily)